MMERLLPVSVFLSLMSLPARARIWFSIITHWQTENQKESKAKQNKAKQKQKALCKRGVIWDYSFTWCLVPRETIFLLFLQEQNSFCHMCKCIPLWFLPVCSPFIQGKVRIWTEAFGNCFWCYQNFDSLLCHSESTKDKKEHIITSSSSESIQKQYTKGGSLSGTQKKKQHDFHNIHKLVTFPEKMWTLS